MDEEIIIKKGDIFFAKLKDLKAWAIVEHMSMGDPSDSYWSGSSNSDSDFAKDQKIDGSILLTFKYLGKGEVEEMTTKEKFILETEDLYSMKSKQSYDLEDRSKSDFAELHEGYLNYEEYKREQKNLYEDNAEIGALKYTNEIEDFKKFIMKYPLYLYTLNIVSCDDEDAKKEYLKHSDDERKSAVLNLKKAAINEVKDIYQKLDEEVKKVANIDKEAINMAYLENNLYNYKNR